MFLVFLITAILASILFYARRGGLGELGRKIRNSDHWALEDAIADKKDEISKYEKYLKENKGKELQTYILDYINDKKQELAELEALRPKYKLEVKEDNVKL